MFLAAACSISTFPVCPSVCLSVCHSFFNNFLASDFYQTFRKHLSLVGPRNADRDIQLVAAEIFNAVAAILMTFRAENVGF